jgi:formate dehydrogenase major subunit
MAKPVSDRPGPTITEMVPAMLAERLKALCVIGENPKCGGPDWQHLHHALKELDFLAAQDLFLMEAPARITDAVRSGTLFCRSILAKTQPIS